MFKAGELIKRKETSTRSPRALCMIVGKDKDNYTLYNNSTRKLNIVACVVVNNLYTKHSKCV